MRRKPARRRWRRTRPTDQLARLRRRQLQEVAVMAEPRNQPVRSRVLCTVQHNEWFYIDADVTQLDDDAIHTLIGRTYPHESIVDIIDAELVS